MLPAIVALESIFVALLAAWVWLLYRRLNRVRAAASAAETRLREAERRDVVQRSEAERRAAALREELAHFGRVSLVEALAGSLVHEINQPLTAVMANTEAALRLMTAQPPRWQELRETLTEVLSDNRRAADVLQRMRTLLKKGTTRYEPIELNAVVREVAKVVQTYVTGRQIAFDIELASDLPAVMGDRVQVQQVLLNLLMNAFDAVAAREAADRHVRLQTVARAQTAIVDVTDRGAGVTDEELAVIFEPFYTTKGEGLGLGLSISRAIVTAHGGTLGAARNPETGMTFSASFPCWRPLAPDQPPSADARLQGQR